MKRYDDFRPCDENQKSVHYVTGYHYTSGTSFAAPYVTGVAALIMAEYPNLTIAEIKDRILQSVDMKTSFFGKCVTGGRLNAYKALHDHNSYVFCEYYDGTCHKGYCSCGAYEYKSHAWTEISGLVVCLDCGYTIG